MSPATTRLWRTRSAAWIIQRNSITMPILKSTLVLQWRGEPEESQIVKVIYKMGVEENLHLRFKTITMTWYRNKEGQLLAIAVKISKKSQCRLSSKNCPNRLIRQLKYTNLWPLSFSIANLRRVRLWRLGKILNFLITVDRNWVPL